MNHTTIHRITYFVIYIEILFQVQIAITVELSFIDFINTKEPTNSSIKPIIELINLHVLHLSSFAKF